MSRCSNDVVVKTLTQKKLNKQSQIFMTALTDLEACTDIRFRDWVDAGESGHYDAGLRPDDVLQCKQKGCTTTGTRLFARGDTGTGQDVMSSYSLATDALAFATGIVTFFVWASNAVEGATLAFSISDYGDVENMDTYAGARDLDVGFNLITIDLGTVPPGMGGTGWLPSTRGVAISISIIGVPHDVSLGLSTLRIFDSIHDFLVNETVALDCLDDITGSQTMDITASTCFGSTYDEQSMDVSLTINARGVTPNYIVLSPFARRVDDGVGTYIETVERTVVEEIRNGVRYGMVQLADMSEDECRFLLAQKEDECSRVEGWLNHVALPIEISLGDNQFQRLQNGVVADRGKLLFNERLIGQNVIVAYPKDIEGQIIIFDGANANKKSVSAKVVSQFSDGTKIIDTYDRWLITSFPHTLSSEETVFSFTITATRDRGEGFFKRLIAA
ncbi:MAG: hypothetical protein FWE25_03290 [Lachnospiraceae bacterium]|nr:hypothetical protein [Lachnospiraceae bacterium]